MIRKCPERKRLSLEYEAALKLYISAVSTFARLYGSSNSPMLTADARAMLDDRYVRIQQHCFEHGCDRHAGSAWQPLTM
jgi:hypothetical protein